VKKAYMNEVSMKSIFHSRYKWHDLYIPVKIQTQNKFRSEMSQELGFEIHLDQPYEAALEKVIAALKSEGFGVLTRIDVQATLKEKLGEDFRSYVILGACNPSLAHRALQTDPVVGLLLPCNVTVETDPLGGSLARIANPEIMLTVGPLEHNATLQEVASLARAKLERVAEALLEA
jgi:uncharacterized protein (DUF302 family)